MKNLVTGPAAEFTFRRKRFLLVPVPTDANGRLMSHTFPNCFGCVFDHSKYEDSDGYCTVDEEIETQFGLRCTEQDRIFIRKSKDGIDAYNAKILKGKITT